MLPKRSARRRPAWPGDPVRRGPSIRSPPPLEYWIARFRGRRRL